jgi:hypothetical protein
MRDHDASDQTLEASQTPDDLDFSSREEADSEVGPDPTFLRVDLEFEIYGDHALDGTRLEEVLKWLTAWPRGEPRRSRSLLALMSARSGDASQRLQRLL